MKKKNNLKNVFDNLEILLGIISGLFFYLAKIKKIENCQYIFLFCLLLFGIVYFIDSYKLSEETEMSTYHLVRSFGLLILAFCLLLLKCLYNKSIGLILPTN